MEETEGKLPWQIAKEKEEERLRNQTQFDPKVHGVGTAPVLAPGSVTELHKLTVAAFDKLAAEVASLTDRVTFLESKQIYLDK